MTAWPIISDRAPNSSQPKTSDDRWAAHYSQSLIFIWSLRELSSLSRSSDLVKFFPEKSAHFFRFQGSSEGRHSDFCRLPQVAVDKKQSNWNFLNPEPFELNRPEFKWSKLDRPKQDLPVETQIGPLFVAFLDHHHNWRPFVIISTSASSSGSHLILGIIYPDLLTSTSILIRSILARTHLQCVSITGESLHPISTHHTAGDLLSHLAVTIRQRLDLQSLHPIFAYHMTGRSVISSHCLDRMAARSSIPKSNSLQIIRLADLSCCLAIAIEW